MFNINTVSDIREEFKRKLKQEEFKTDKSGCKMLEIPGACFVADENSIFRKPSEEYIQRELEWYKSKSLYVKDIPGKVPAIWEAISDSEGKINSNYGYLIYSEENHSQYIKVLNVLEENINSRQAVMIYQRPTMHEDAYLNGMSDFVCTMGHQYLWNGESLDAIVMMRSNDTIRGYRNDYAWAEHVHLDLCADLGVSPGRIYWNAGSLHVYEPDFYLIHHFSETGETNISLKKYKEIYTMN